jgi:ParB family transcriptional regulator, chromosome partitioning protein
MTTVEGARELQQVDPRNLQLENNVRAEASLTKDFIASVKELGVLMPVIAVRNPDGTLLVRAGQRRTAAAREAGLPAIPVYVTDAGTDDASRLVTQIVENDQRLGLEADDRALGIQALIDTGMSVTKVAKRLSIPAAQVKQSSAVARSKAALEALQQASLTLDEAAEIAEFEDDPEAVAALIDASKRRYFDHELARQKSNREYRKNHAKAAEVYTKLGMTVLDERPDWGDDAIVSEYYLIDADGNEVDRQAVLASAAATPQAWAVRLEEESVFTDAEGGTVPDSAIDWATEGDPDREPEEGFVHADSVQETIVFIPAEYYCIDRDATAALALSERFLRQQANGGVGTTTPSIADREAEKRERRKVLALNKAGDAAVGVRRAFVTTLLQRKTTPKGAAQFVAKVLTTDPGLLSGYGATVTAAELLGVENLAVAAAQITDQRADVITLGLVLGALETRAPKGAWRAPSAHTVGPKEYLGFLAECGYTLSTVEQVMVGAKTSDEALEEDHHSE